MFSVEKAIRVEEPFTSDFRTFLNYLWEEFIAQSELCAGMLCSCNENCKQIQLLASAKIPSAPFIGSRKAVLDLCIRECFAMYPAPHVHSIGRSDLWREISAVTQTADWQKRAVFLPIFVRGSRFVVLGFFLSEADIKPEDCATEQLLSLIDFTALLMDAFETERKLKGMELYVKEVGHDIASSVQAIISKLRNVSRGLINGPSALEKVREAEEEIMSTYRIADTLGITVDPNYNIGNARDFDVIGAARAVIGRCLSEASERHIEIIENFLHPRLIMLGDERAIQSALTQLLMNAIKYAKGSSYITVRLKKEAGRNVEFSVTDLGIPIDNEEKVHMWQFGYRGRRALELHVNGSGIGLYTVKKIATAHGGIYGMRTGRDSESVVTFFFTIPLRDILKKNALL